MLRAFVFALIAILFYFTLSPSTSALGAIGENGVPKTSEFRVPYSVFSSAFDTPSPLQVFGGGLLLREFFDTQFPGQIMAGHLGSWWAPPYLSASIEHDKSSQGFSTGLVIKNTRHPTSVYENSANHSLTTTFWSPNKLEVENFYPGTDGGTRIRGAKMALPDVRGFAMKITVKNESSTPQGFNIMTNVLVPQMGKSSNWNWGISYGWPQSSGLTARYLPTERVAIVADPSTNAYLLVGIQDGPTSWEVKDFASFMQSIDQFRTATPGRLTNSGLDSNLTSGSAISFVVDTADLPQNQTFTYTLMGFAGGSEAEVLALWNQHRNIADLEAYAQQNFDQKLTDLFTNQLPQVKFQDKKLQNIYYISSLQYLLHRWESLDLVNEQNYRANSIAFFPWTTGTETFLTMADRVFWRQQLLKAVSVDYKSCRTYSPFGNLCDVAYVYDRFSLVKQLTDYFNFTQDTVLLSQVIDNLASRIEEIDLLFGANQLADFGGERNLYEFGISDAGTCNLAGVYTGKVPSPNAERYWANLQLSELYKKLGNTEKSNLHADRASQNRTALNQLYNSSAGWFDTISQSGQRTTFMFQPVFNMLGYTELLSAEQTSQLLAKVPEFTGPYGFYSLPKDVQLQNPGCTRPDWHGPGLYSGSIGLMLQDMFTLGYKEDALHILSDNYGHLSDWPVWGQQYLGDSPRLESFRSWYLESVSFAQSLIKGMMGLQPDVDMTWLRPRIPDSLLAQGPIQFKGAWSQGSLWDLEAMDGQSTRLTITAAAGPLQFGWDGESGVAVRVNNLHNNLSYQVITESGSATLASIQHLITHFTHIYDYNRQVSDFHQETIIKTANPVDGVLEFDLPHKKTEVTIISN